jgi:two-component system, OmpR family, response regulator RegX3
MVRPDTNKFNFDLGATLNIAILERDAAVATEMKKWLEELGHRIQVFDSGKNFLVQNGKPAADVIIFDWELRGAPTGEILRWLRVEAGPSTPMLIATARNAEGDVVTALAGKADDFVVRPVRRNELVARVNALIRRTAQSGREPIEHSFPPFRIMSASRQIFFQGDAINLTEKEFDLAIFLFQNSGKLLSRDYISENVWARQATPQSRTIDTHISRVRKKLGLEPGNGYRLVPVYNIGYRLERVLSPADLQQH